MYLTDFHLHTELSPDSEAPLARMVEAAAAAGLSELCVTDHYDALLEHGGRAAPYDWAPALSQFERVQRAMGARIAMRLGVEFGCPHVDTAAADALVAPAHIDFIIGSVHNWSEQNGGGDFFFSRFESADDCYRALDDYFSSMEQLVALPAYYDSLGHIIYPLRYMKFPVTLARYEDRLRAILRAVIDSGRGIEINTYRGRTVSNWAPILKTYRALGGELVTVGSDAHRPEHVGLGVPDAYELLRTCGFSYVSVYEKRAPRQIRL